MSILAPAALPPAVSSADIAVLKASLRAESLARRDALPADAREAASAAIADRLMTVGIPAGAAVSAFLPIRSEVDLRPAIAALQAAGHPIGLPVMRKPDLVFRTWTPDTPLVPLGFGTLGPPEGSPEIRPDVMLVPLSVFDRAGGRIGYGKAFYDITIAGFRAAGHDPRLIGIGFSVQEADRVPMEAHDVPLHLVVTEREIVMPRGSD